MEGKLFGFVMLFFAVITLCVPFFLFGTDLDSIKFYASPYLILIGLGIFIAGIAFLGFKKMGNVSAVLIILAVICFIASSLTGLFIF